MTIEELSKAQLVLLVLLITFVSSIATSIVAVSLLNQAPTEVTKTINQVVERTVERVVPNPNQLGASVITKETTVVVKEEDLITTSIQDVSPSVVRLYRIAEQSVSTSTDTFVGLGFFVDSKGTLVTDGSLVRDEQDYRVVTSTANEFFATIERRVSSLALIVPHIDIETEETITSSPVTLADAESHQLGQTVISLSGKERTNVSVGIISSLLVEPATIESTVNISQTFYGSPLINMFGEVVGIHIQGSTGHIPVVLEIEESKDLPEGSEEIIEG